MCSWWSTSCWWWRITVTRGRDRPSSCGWETVTRGTHNGSPRRWRKALTRRTRHRSSRRRISNVNHIVLTRRTRIESIIADIRRRWCVLNKHRRESILIEAILRYQTAFEVAVCTIELALRHKRTVLENIWFLYNFHILSFILRCRQFINFHKFTFSIKRHLLVIHNHHLLKASCKVLHFQHESHK